MRKSEFVKGISALVLGTLLCVAAFDVIQSISHAKPTPREGGAILSLIAEAIHQGEYWHDDILKEDRRYIVVSEGIPDSWWEHVDSERGGIRLLTDEELRNLNKKGTPIKSVLKVSSLGATPEKQPLFSVVSMQYYWTSLGQLVGEDSHFRMQFCAVRSQNQWHVIPLVPTSME